MYKRLFYFIAIGLLAVPAGAGGQQAGRYMGRELVGRTAPPFRLPQLSTALEPGIRILSRDSLSLSSLRGKPVVLNFWYTSCPPCVEEIPMLNAVAGELRGQVHFVAVTMNDSPARVREHFEGSQEIKYPVVFARGSKVEADYGIVGAPTTVVINSKGIVVAKFFGGIEEVELRKLIATARAK